MIRLFVIIIQLYECPDNKKRVIGFPQRGARFALVGYRGTIRTIAPIIIASIFRHLTYIISFKHHNHPVK